MLLSALLISTKRAAHLNQASNDSRASGDRWGRHDLVQTCESPSCVADVLRPRLPRPSTPRAQSERDGGRSNAFQHPYPGCSLLARQPSTPRAQSERDGGRSNAFQHPYPGCSLLARQPSTPRAQSERDGGRSRRRAHASYMRQSTLLTAEHRARLALAVSQSRGRDGGRSSRHLCHMGQLSTSILTSFCSYTHNLPRIEQRAAGSGSTVD